VAAQFQLPVQGAQRRRILEALAYDPVAPPARLSLFSAGRKPSWQDTPVRQFDDYHATRWIVAWGKLDVRRLGRASWHVLDCQPRVGCSASVDHETAGGDTAAHRARRRR